MGTLVTQRGVKVTARRMVESVLAGSGCRCVDCGAELTREEIGLVYHLHTSQPRCSRCGGYSIEAAYPTADRMQSQEDYRAWRMAERATELLH